MFRASVNLEEPRSHFWLKLISGGAMSDSSSSSSSSSSASWSPPTPNESLRALLEEEDAPPPVFQALAQSGLYSAMPKPKKRGWLNGPGVKDRKGQKFCEWLPKGMARKVKRSDKRILLVPLGELLLINY